MPPRWGAKGARTEREVVSTRVKSTRLTNLTNSQRRGYPPQRHEPEASLSKPYNIYDAKTHLSRLVDRAAAGEDIIIAKAGRPVARLVPLEPLARRVPGDLKGRVWISPDFDAPLPSDVQRYFDGEGED